MHWYQDLVEGSLVCPASIVYRGKDMVWHMATEPFVTHTVECIPITTQHSVTCYLKYVKCLHK